jgi:hypothetical protein
MPQHTRDLYAVCAAMPQIWSISCVDHEMRHCCTVVAPSVLVRVQSSVLVC